MRPCSGEAGKVRGLLAARHAPRRPEVHEDDPPAEVAETHQRRDEDPLPEPGAAARAAAATGRAPPS